ncbi:MAG: antitoxin VbhA family protein [Mycobacteriaceae bacterium]
MKQLTDMETEEGRREAVLEAMGSFALEGMQPTADTVAWARDYIAGRLTTAQILQRLKRKYGVD